MMAVSLIGADPGVESSATMYSNSVMAPTAWGFCIGGWITFTDSANALYVARIHETTGNDTTNCSIQAHAGEFRMMCRNTGGATSGFQYSGGSTTTYNDGEPHHVALWCKAADDWRLYVDGWEVEAWAPESMDGVTLSTLDTVTFGARFAGDTATGHLECRLQRWAYIDAAARPNRVWPRIIAMRWHGRAQEQDWFTNGEGIAYWSFEDETDLSSLLQDDLNDNDLTGGYQSNGDPAHYADFVTTEWSNADVPDAGLLALRYLSATSPRGFNLEVQQYGGRSWPSPRTASLARRIGVTDFYAMTHNVIQGKNWGVTRPDEINHASILDPADVDPADIGGPWRAADNPSPWGDAGQKTWSWPAVQANNWSNGRVCEVSIMQWLYDVAYWYEQDTGGDWQTDDIYIMIDEEKAWEASGYSPLHPARFNDAEPRDDGGATDGVEVANDKLVSFTAPDTITHATGWTTTPTAGQFLQVSGSPLNNGEWKVASASSTVITVDDTVATITTEAAGGADAIVIRRPSLYAFGHDGSAGVTTPVTSLLQQHRRLRIVEIVKAVMPNAIVGEYGTPLRRIQIQHVIDPVYAGLVPGSGTDDTYDNTGGEGVDDAKVDGYFRQWIDNMAPGVAACNCQWPNFYAHSELPNADGHTVYSLGGEMTIGATILEWAPSVTVNSGALRDAQGDTFEEIQTAIVDIWSRIQLAERHHRRSIVTLVPRYVAKSWGSSYTDASGTESYGYELIHPDRIKAYIDCGTWNGVAIWHQFIWDVYNASSGAIYDRVRDWWGLDETMLVDTDEGNANWRAMIERWGVGAMQAFGFALDALRYDESTQRWRIRRGWRRRQRRTRNP